MSDLQFDKAEFKDHGAAKNGCEHCRAPLAGEYYQVNGTVACPSCKDKFGAMLKSGNPALRVLKAFALGIPAAMVGAGIYYAILALTGYELGIVAIAIGWGVGWAVHKGSERRGGIPLMEKDMVESEKQEHTVGAHGGAPVQLSNDGTAVNAAESDHWEKPKSAVGLIFFYTVLFVLSLAVPFMMGFQNIIGLLIIGFGLWQAIQMNRKFHCDVKGPFQISPSATS